MANDYRGSDSAKAFGLLLRRIRGRRTQAKFAELISSVESTVRNMEKGRNYISEPSFKHIRAKFLRHHDELTVGYEAMTGRPVSAEPVDLSASFGADIPNRKALLDRLRTAPHDEFEELICSFRGTSQQPPSSTDDFRAALWARIHQFDDCSGLAGLLLLYLTQGDEPHGELLAKVLSIADYSAFPDLPLPTLVDPAAAAAMTSRLLERMDALRDGDPSLYFLRYILSHACDAFAIVYFNRLSAMWRWAQCQANPLAWPTFLGLMNTALQLHCSPEPTCRATPEVMPSPLSADDWNSLLRDLSVMRQQRFDGSAFGDASAAPHTCWEYTIWMLADMLSMDGYQDDVPNYDEVVDFYQDIIADNLEYIAARPHLDVLLRENWVRTANQLRMHQRLRVLQKAIDNLDRPGANVMFPEVFKLFESVVTSLQQEGPTYEEQMTIGKAFRGMRSAQRKLSAEGSLSDWHRHSEHAALLLGGDDILEAIKDFHRLFEE